MLKVEKRMGILENAGYKRSKRPYTKLNESFWSKEKALLYPHDTIPTFEPLQLSTILQTPVSNMQKSDLQKMKLPQLRQLYFEKHQAPPPKISKTLLIEELID